MTRRILLKLAWILGFLPLAGGLGAAERPRSVLAFYVAGVRFQEGEPGPLQSGDKVLVRRESGIEPCYGVYSDSMVRLGYVPRHMVEALIPANRLVGVLEDTRLHALPWKRYRVSVPLG